MSTWDDKPNDYQHALAIIAALSVRNAELEQGMDDYACTGTEKPCGCYQLLSKEKTVIAELVAAAQRIVQLAGEFGEALDEEWEAAIGGIRGAIAKASGEKVKNDQARSHR